MPQALDAILWGVVVSLVGIIWKMLNDKIVALDKRIGQQDQKAEILEGKISEFWREIFNKLDEINAKAHAIELNERDLKAMMLQTFMPKEECRRVEDSIKSELNKLEGKIEDSLGG